jgi:hypothetical protein
MAGDSDLPSVRQEHAAQNINESALAGAVFTYQRMDAPWLEKKINVLEGLDTGKGLADLDELG